MKTAKVNGTEFAYDERGSGEPVLLIGTGPIADSFRPLLADDELTRRHRMVTYRQRRAAVTPDGTRPVSFEEHAADAAALLRELGIVRAHVAGHSTGAAIALQLAVDVPSVVHSLTLLELPILTVPGAAPFFDRAGRAIEAYVSGDRETAMATFLSVVSGLDWDTCRTTINNQVEGGVEQAIRDADNFFGSYLPSLQAWKFGDTQADAISQPVLSVLGTETDQLFVDSYDLLHEWFADIEDCEIAGAGHLLHIQRPEPVVRGIAAFLDRHHIGGH